MTSGATLTIDTDGGFLYDPASSFVGDDEFTYTVSSGSTLATGTVDIAVAAAAPAAAAPAEVNVEEDGSVAVGGIAITDPNAGSSILQVELFVQDGTLALKTSASITSGDIAGNGDGQITVTGTLSALNAILATGNGLIYTPNTAGFSGSDDLNITVLDQVNTLTGSADIDVEVLATGSSYGFVTTTYYGSLTAGSTQVMVERLPSALSGSVLTPRRGRPPAAARCSLARIKPWRR